MNLRETSCVIFLSVQEQNAQKMHKLDWWLIRKRGGDSYFLSYKRTAISG